ncbi:MAG TPA: zinc-binding dehydrogenase [candidate division Zixibacteria bacterium]|nr:zinc-binding dehydrogenase [candidate division Zixibacteria bacterium]
MKALRLHGARNLQLHDEPRPVPRLEESLLQIKAVGICGSDLHWFEEAGIGDEVLKRPIALGHEFAGVVESGALSGKRVAIDPAIPCDHCALCKEGKPNLCLDLMFAGHGLHDGALRQLIIWPDKCLFPLPDAMTYEDGAMLEPLGVALHAVDLGHLKPGMTVSVHGCGPIGLLILQVAQLSGATKIIATDKLEHRLNAARRFGAAEVVRADDTSAESQEVLKETDYGVDVAFEAAGENPAVVAAINSVKPGGRVILVGIPADDRTTFQASVARRKGATISLVRRMKHTYPRAIRLVQQGLIDVRSLVTHRFSLDEFEVAFSTARKREGLKVIIKP